MCGEEIIVEDLQLLDFKIDGIIFCSNFTTAVGSAEVENECE
jgi:hypothetical protein